QPPPPPSPTLLPYTTLFRSPAHMRRLAAIQTPAAQRESLVDPQTVESRLRPRSSHAQSDACSLLEGLRPVHVNTRPGPVPHAQRSEEHTSELQSRGHLVCRL